MTSPPFHSRIAQLSNELANQPLDAPLESFLYLLESICELVDASSSIAIWARRQRHYASSHPMRGWEVVHTLYLNENARDESVRKALIQSMNQDDEPLIDESLQAHLKHTGRDRAYLWGELLPGKRFTEAAAYPALYEPVGLHDRMFGVLNLCEELEVYFCLDRQKSEPLFGKPERQRLGACLASLRPHTLRYTMMMGLLPGQEALSPREQETLRALLRGLSEKEVSVEMGLTTRSAHQYVTRVYRKLGVNSRAQLMALWLNTSRALQ